MCTTTKMEAGKSAGRLETIVSSDWIDPAEPPITTISLGCNRSPLSVANRVARRSYGWRQFRKGRLPAITGAPTPTEAASVATSGGVGQTLQLRSAQTCEPYFHLVTLDVNDMSALRMLNMSTLASTQRRVVTLTALIGSCDRGFKVELQNFGRTT